MALWEATPWVPFLVFSSPHPTPTSQVLVLLWREALRTSSIPLFERSNKILAHNVQMRSSYIVSRTIYHKTFNSEFDLDLSLNNCLLKCFCPQWAQTPKINYGSLCRLTGFLRIVPCGWEFWKTNSKFFHGNCQDWELFFFLYLHTDIKTGKLRNWRQVKVNEHLAEAGSFLKITSFGFLLLLLLLQKCMLIIKNSNNKKGLKVKNNISFPSKEDIFLVYLMQKWSKMAHQAPNAVLLCLVTQLCQTLCGPMGCSPSGSSVHGNSPGKNTGEGYHALLQGIFPTQGSNPGLLHCRRFFTI